MPCQMQASWIGCRSWVISGQTVSGRNPAYFRLNKVSPTNPKRPGEGAK